MKRTILRLMSLILILQGILTIGITKATKQVAWLEMWQSKEIIALVIGCLLVILERQENGRLL